MDGHDRPPFNKLQWWLVTLAIFVHCKRLIARKIAEIFSSNIVVQPFLEPCCFDELSRGSVLCLLTAGFRKQFHNATTWFYAKIDDHGVCWDNMGQMFVLWWCTVASRVALDLLYQAICSQSRWCIIMAIKMACNGGTFVCCRHLFCLTNCCSIS